jgi:hypothetical protein
MDDLIHLLVNRLRMEEDRKRNPGIAEVERAKDQVRRSERPSEKLVALVDIDWLTRFVPLLQKAMPWIGEKPAYFFLDDYSLPRVNEVLQTILNSVVKQDAFAPAAGQTNRSQPTVSYVTARRSEGRKAFRDTGPVVGAEGSDREALAAAQVVHRIVCPCVTHSHGISNAIAPDLDLVAVDNRCLGPSRRGCSLGTGCLAD